jgi:hypothetical protein
MRLYMHGDTSRQPREFWLYFTDVVVLLTLKISGTQLHVRVDHRESSRVRVYFLELVALSILEA